MIVALAVLRVAWPYLLGALALAIGYWQAQHWCNSVCVEARAEVAQLQDEKLAAQKRVAEIEARWAAKVEKAAAAARQRKVNNDTKFSALAERARTLPAGNGIAVSAAAARVFDDVSIAANDTAAAAGSSAPAAAVPAATDERRLAGWALLAGQAYRDAVNQWQSCVDHYDAVSKETQ